MQKVWNLGKSPYLRFRKWERNPTPKKLFDNIDSEKADRDGSRFLGLYVVFPYAI